VSGPLASAGASSRVPPFRFSARSRVEVADTDLGAVMYYARYPVHLDRAVIAYRRHLGIAPLGPPGHLFVVRSVTLDYRASARFDDVVEVFVRTAAIGRTSHTLEARMERVAGEGGELLAEARLTIVGLAAYGGRASRMPEEMRAALAAFEEPG
jgi:acyl-CoA thioester hydrolase